MFILLLAFIDPGSALLVLRDGKPIQTKVEGAADIQTGRKITAKTNFRLASITKQFTATAILLLAKDGKLAVNDAVGKHIPGWPPYASGVTIRHLLTHTSGLLITITTSPTQLPSSPTPLSSRSFKRRML